MNDVDRMKRGLLEIVTRLLAPTRWHAPYLAKIVSQNADGTLEVTPTDPSLPGLSRVPIRLGIPGASVSVKGGSYVIVEFDGGDSRQPYASVYDSSTLDSITITASTSVTVNAPIVNLGDEDGQPVARLGDLVTSALPPEMPVVGTVSGAPFAGTITILDPVVGVITGSAAKTSAS